jgi:ferredoxin
MKTSGLPPQLLALARTVSRECTQCRTCQIRCVFLRDHGTPKDLADHLLGSGVGVARAFECSLCGLCEAVCPMHLPLPDFFLAMRRAALKNGAASLTPYRSLLNYETVGASFLFRLFALPPGGDTVLFPGCIFPGAHPRTAQALYRHLRRRTRPWAWSLAAASSHPTTWADRIFLPAVSGHCAPRSWLGACAPSLTACPNCFKVFSQYGDGLAVRSVLSALAENPPQGRTPCMARPSCTRLARSDLKKKCRMPP